MSEHEMEGETIESGNPLKHKRRCRTKLSGRTTKQSGGTRVEDEVAGMEANEQVRGLAHGSSERLPTRAAAAAQIIKRLKLQPKLSPMLMYECGYREREGERERERTY